MTRIKNEYNFTDFLRKWDVQGIKMTPSIFPENFYTETIPIGWSKILIQDNAKLWSDKKWTSMSERKGSCHPDVVEGPL